MKRLIFYAFLSSLSGHLIAQQAGKAVGSFGQEVQSSDLEELNHMLTIENLPREVNSLVRHLPISKDEVYQYQNYSAGSRRGMVKASNGGKTVFEAEYRSHKLHGRWVRNFGTGQLLDSGNFTNNLPDGVWRTWHKNGKPRSIRTYSASKLASIRNSAARYNYKLRSSNPLVSMAVHDEGTFQRITSSVYSFSGIAGTETYAPPYKTCLHDGLYMNFFESGAVKDSGYYKNGLRDGLWVENFESGQVYASGAYLKGQKDGGWKYYDKTGRLAALAEYKEGKMMHRKNY